MAEKRNFTALDWVAGEIGETLNQASAALEAYALNTEDTTKIRFCLNHIHQIFNILQMVELHGGALLAEEMEKLAQALIDKKVVGTTDAHEVLMRAILQLPVYLDRVKFSRSDDPASLMGLLNDLRAVRSENLFTETQLFAPDMRAARIASGQRVRFDDVKFREVMEKLSQMYEQVMAGITRDRNYDDHLPGLKKVFENFRKVCQGSPRAPLWDIGLAVVEGIENDTIPASVALNNLLQDVDREIRHMSSVGVVSLEEYTPDELIKNLLYYIACSRASSPLIMAIRESYRLDRALPGMQAGLDETTLGAPDPEAMRSVVIALSEEFGRIKEIFDSYVNGIEVSNDALKSAISVFKQTGDTLAVLGFADMRKKTEQVVASLTAQIDSGGLANADSLLEAASRLVEIESSLNARYNRDGHGGDGSPASMDHAMLSAHETVLHECQNGLEQAKDAIIEYIASQWDSSHLVSLPELLQAVRGGLEIIGQRRTARVLGACSRYIKEQLIDGRLKPDFNTMDTLADAIASVEYYLECLDDDVVEDQDTTLSLAEASVATLGYAVAAHQRAQQAFTDDIPDIEQLDSVVPVLSQAVQPAAEELVAATQQDSVAVSAQVELIEDTPLISEEELAVLESSSVVNLAIDSNDVAPEPVVADSGIPEIRAESKKKKKKNEKTPEETKPAAVDESVYRPVELGAVPVIEPVIASKPEFIDAPLVIEDLDQEISEIFIEEATEVLDHIREFYPKWRADLADTGSLTEFRRGFHTLKGSGRMVKALELGELAWSVENMLNRVIDGTIEPSEDLCVVIDHVVEKLPSMIEAFGQLKVDPQPALSQRLYDAAFAIASGQPLPSLEAPDSAIIQTEAALPESADVFTTVTAEPEVLPGLSTDVSELADADTEFDFTLWDIFSSEAETHLEVADAWIAGARDLAPMPVEPTDPLQRALHTLKGSAYMAEVAPIAELASPLERLVKELRGFQIKVGVEFIDLLADAVTEIRYGLSLIEKRKLVSLPQSEAILARIEELRLNLLGQGAVTAGSDSSEGEEPVEEMTRFDMFLVSEMDALMDVAPFLAQWTEQQDASGLDRIVFELEEMAAGAEERSSLLPIASLARAIVPCYAHAQTSHRVFTAWEPLALEAHNDLIDFMDRMAASEDLFNNTELEERLAAFCATDMADIEVVSEPVAESVVESEIQFAASSASDDAEMLAGLDAELLGIFLDEADELLEQLESEVHQWREDRQAAGMADALRRTLHTFKGGARMSGLMLLGTLAHDLETELEHFSGEASDTLIDMLQDCQDKLFRGVSMVHAWRRGDASQLNFASLVSGNPAAALPVDDVQVAETAIVEPAIVEESPIVEVAKAIEEVPVVEVLRTVEPAVRSAGVILEYSDDIEIDLLDIFLDEASELVEELEQLVADWQSAPEDNSFADALRRNLHTLKGGARMAGLTGLGSLGHDLETQLEHFAGPASQELFIQILQYQDAILGGVAQGRAIAAGQSPQPLTIPVPGISAVEYIEPVIVADVQASAGEALVAEAVSTVEVGVPVPDIAEPVVEVAAAEVVAIPVPEEETAAQREFAITLDEIRLADDVDPAMLALFTEEADELLEDLDAQIQGWRSAPEDRSFCDALKRNLHTFKGGARMCGVMGIGDLAHDLETHLEQLSGSADDTLFSILHSYQDKLIASVAVVHRVTAGESIADMKAAAAKPAAVVPQSVTPVVSPSLPTEKPATAAEKPTATATIIPFRGGQLPRGLEEAIAGKKGTQAAADAKAAQAQQEMIKVSADLLENLVNLAGETSISRSRVEQQMIDIERTAEEMESTIVRLQDQLRRLEAETDAQIQSRQAEIQERSDDFDPLEMDRYSTVQQLTSSLSESASDLLDIRNSLNNKLRDTETLLVQQARINTGLQEGLMRSRMVPFSRLEPRLRRIIRQVATELKKDIVFDLENVQGELDRTMLERMVAPLEHMLRNACDHGIETPEKRIAAGKSKQGRVVLSLSREGGDILISLRDDGGGINVDAVRKKAIERGLLTLDAPITDSEALQFILQAGFSTAEKVTQISGRGVGMDVVNSEIKAMGGSMTIHSAVGKGSEFIVRLPFTVSVNRALMVRLGEDMYAIPLTSIEGIVRVSPFELESYYDDPEARFEYAGRDYEVRYLGNLLQTKLRPNLDLAVTPEPVILLRSSEHTVALHVDQLIGSREIVVKALGLQFASVPGLSGATLLGDGSVVVILDLLALVRANLALESTMFRLEKQAAAEPEIEENITVMVCDDSVTVRKVTSRLLEREGFNVMLAKDGADALLQMQDHLPDILLLDIEMPRMDGFEVASTMKNSQRMQDIPIIMITSRTGEKHRDRATGMGVDRYMGKPFVEEELLQNINDLVGERLVKRMAQSELSGS
jgi:chemosensory pili system protein ChpA (sensor histidine kinase/response regulator)